MKQQLLYTTQILTALMLASGTAVSQNTTNQHIQSGFIEHLDSHGSSIPDEPFFCIINGVRIYFTVTGLSYEVKGYLSREEDEAHGEEGAEANNEQWESEYEPEISGEGRDSISHHFQVEFFGASENIQILAQEIRKDYFVSGNNQRCSVFDKVTYHNVWPNIDIEFAIPKAGGLKYAVILREGAELSTVQLDYSDALDLALSENGLFVKTEIGSWLEYNPTTFDATGGIIESNYILNDSIVSFHIDGYTSTTSYVIDPWIDLLPVITAYDDLPNPVDSVWSYLGFEQLSGTGLNNSFNRVQMDYDVQGNIYVAQIPALFFNSDFGPGSYYSVGSFLIKYNSAGEQLFLSDLGYEDGFFTDITINKQTQEIYSKRSAELLIYSDSNGFEVEEFNIENQPGETTEICSMQYDHCQETLLLGLGGSFDPNPKFIASISPTLTSNFSYHDSYDYSASVSDFLPYNDNVDISIDPYSGDYLMLFLLRSSFQLDQRALVNLNANDMSSIWQTNNDFVPFTELYMHSLGLLTIPVSNHFEALACGPEFVYAFNGGELVRINKMNGNILETVALPNANTSRTEGIDTDMCGNVYIGQMNAVKVYDSELNNIGTIPIQGVPQDLAVTGNKLIVAGDFNIQVIDIPDNIKPWNITATPDSCDLCVGQASISFCNSEGIPSNVEVEWIENGSTGQSASGLCQGWYHVIIREFKNCLTMEYSDSVFVGFDEATNCVFSISTGNYGICEGECTTIVVEANSASGAVTFNWGNGIITSSNELEVCEDSSTVYMIVAQDEDGGVDTTYANINVLPFPIVDLGPDTVLCPGSAWLLDAGNTGLNFVWQDNSVNQFLNVTEEGLYGVTVSNGVCSSFDQTEIAYSNLSVDLGPDLNVCDPAIVVLDAGQNGNTYLWSDGSTEQLLSLSDFGDYSVIVSDAYCDAVDFINISLGDIQLDLGPDHFICAGSLVTLSSGLTSGQFMWSTGSSQPEIVISEAGIYSLEVSEGQCYGMDSVEIVISTIESAFTTDNTVGCSPLTTLFLDESVSNLGTVNQWQWNFGDGTQSTVQNPVHQFLSSGAFEVSVQVSNEYNCTATYSTLVNVTIYPSPVALFSYSPETPTVNEEIEFTDESLNATIWNWFFGDGNNSTEQNPQNIYTTPGSFEVVLVAANDNCIDSTLYTFFIGDELFVFVPNSFTPNDDLVNDVFAASMVGAEIAEFSMMIFNRWGELIFQTEDQLRGWNGAVQNKSTGENGTYYAPDGAYVWYITIQKDNGAEVFEYTGHVIVMR
jgi:gliding motility-associated-like protein